MTREEMIAAVESELVRLDQIRALLIKSQSERFTFPDAESRTAADLPNRAPKAKTRPSLTQAEKHHSLKQKRVRSAADVN